jgi:CPA2 family monovalent cation:H+ antiporter-2
VGKTLEESGIRSLYGCMVVGLEEGKENLSNFPPKRRFMEGDIIWVVGEEDALQSILAKPNKK